MKKLIGIRAEANGLYVFDGARELGLLEHIDYRNWQLTYWGSKGLTKIAFDGVINRDRNYLAGLGRYRLWLLYEWLTRWVSKWWRKQIGL